MSMNSIDILTEEEFDLFKRGEEKVFRKIFDCYNQMLYSYAHAFTKSAFEAEEAVQESFIQLFRAATSLQSPSQVYPFLFVVTKRTLIKSFRKKVSQAKYSRHLQHMWTERSTCTQEQLDVNELNSLVQAAMRGLSVKEKEVFTLNKLSGLSYDEISDYTGASRNTIKNQIISASKKIRLTLEKYYFPIFFILSLI